MHKDRSRVYYFSAETQELMSRWVNSLVIVTKFRRDPTHGEEPLERFQFSVGSELATRFLFSHDKEISTTLLTDMGMNTIKSVQSVSARTAPFARTPLIVPPSLAPLPSVTTPVNSSWLHGGADAIIETELMDNYPTHGDDSYNDPGAPEVYYSPTGFREEQDEYNPLPCFSHSYVNLTNLNSGTASVGMAHEPVSLRTSCPNLAGDAPMLPARAKSELNESLFCYIKHLIHGCR
ncbi:hypothetical protein FBUS_08356 [Fasciolopsis buskii]|uniref:PH domain-containing protein n=1 Tax=Fasciolopsis buskii TaxID=27845 RepID=A0A8E0VJL7_9TREM|nr:hypothetical protein FBUS_08356 [Fasciolopsis buski]